MTMKKQLGEAFKKMMGDGLNTWVGTDGKAVLQVTAKDWAGARKLLDDHFNGTGTVGGVAAFGDVRKELPAEASVVALFDLVRYAGIVLEFAKPIIESTLPIPLKLPSAPANAPATYSGTAVTLKTDRAGPGHLHLGGDGARVLPGVRPADHPGLRRCGELTSVYTV